MKILRVLGLAWLSILFVAATTAKPKYKVDETPKGMERATFAGGCFWCMEPPFHKVPGVAEVWSGYTGGQKDNPTYEEVSSGGTGHAEAVEVLYDPKKVTYEKLLEVFWRSMDPTDAGGQFADRGNQYRPGIFYRNAAEKKAAEKSKAELDKSGKLKKPVATEITEFKKFYAAEEYHQHYYLKNYDHYNSYRVGSGRAKFLTDTWGSAK